MKRKQQREMRSSTATIFPPGEGMKKSGGKMINMAIAMAEAKEERADTKEVGDRRKQTGIMEDGAMEEATVVKVGTREAGEVAGATTGDL